MVSRLLGHKDWLTTVRFSSDGERLVSGSRDKTVRLWDTNSNTELAVFEGHQDQIVMACFWSNQKTVSVDRTGQLKIWDNDSLREIESWSITQLTDTSEQSVTACGMHEDSGLLAAAEPGLISFWDLATKEKLYSLPFSERVHEIKFSWDGRLVGVASTATEIPLFDVSQLKRVRSIPKPRILRGHVRQVTSLSFSPDNKRLAATGVDESLRIFELELGNEVLKIDDNIGANNRVAFSRDGKQLTSCEGRVYYTYSLDRLDHKAGQTLEQAVTTWHNENYDASVARLNAYAASFHASALVEREPDRLLHKFRLANSLADFGEFDESSKVIQDLVPDKQSDQFARLNILMRSYIASNRVDEFRNCGLDYQKLVREFGKINDWNDFAWYSSLGRSAETDFLAVKVKLEAAIKGGDAEIAKLDELQQKLEKLSRSEEYSDDQLKELGITRQELALNPTSIANKKKSIQKEISLYSNTMALVYYRLGEYENAYRASAISLASDAVARPLDEIIQAMAICRIELLRRGSIDPTETAGVDNIPSSSPELQWEVSIKKLLNQIDYWHDRDLEKQYTVKKRTIDEHRIHQLDIPILLSELQQLLDQMEVNRTINRRSHLTE